jgi:shikimate kinase
MRLSATTKDTWTKSGTSEQPAEKGPSAISRPDILGKTVGKNIALTGFMAVGKSAVGRKLARRLKRPFVDLDQAIEKTAGMKVREIFDQKGEAYFRRLEKQALAEILLRDGQVIATGGGVVLDDENLTLLKEKSLLICLKATPEILRRRAGTGKKRPLLKGHDRKKRIDELLKQRGERYAQAHFSIDTSGLSVKEIVEKIIREIESRSQDSEVRRERKEGF